MVMVHVKVAEEVRDIVEIVSVMDGPNVTRMRSMVLEECNKEEMVMLGSSRRSSITIQEAVPSKQKIILFSLSPSFPPS